MRPVSLGAQPSDSAPVADQLRWIKQSLAKLADASRQEGSTIADPFTLTNVPDPPVRTLDAAAATLTQVRETFATFLRDMQKRGPNQPKP